MNVFFKYMGLFIAFFAFKDVKAEAGNSLPGGDAAQAFVVDSSAAAAADAAQGAETDAAQAVVVDSSAADATQAATTDTTQGAAATDSSDMSLPAVGSPGDVFLNNSNIAQTPAAGADMNEQQKKQLAEQKPSLYPQELTPKINFYMQGVNANIKVLAELKAAWNNLANNPAISQSPAFSQMTEQMTSAFSQADAFVALLTQDAIADGLARGLEQNINQKLGSLQDELLQSRNMLLSLQNSINPQS